MRDLINFFRTVPKSANVIGLGAIALWTIKATVFDHIKAPSAALPDLGRVFEGVLSAVFAGWVFYILFALLPEYRERKIVAPYILGRVARIVGDAQAIVSEIRRVSERSLPFATVSTEEIAAACAATKANTGPNMIMHATGEPATWLDLFNFRRRRTYDAIRDLLTHDHYLEAEIVSLLTLVEDCMFFSFVDMMMGRQFPNADLAVISQSLSEYVLLCRKLATWHDRRLVEGVLPLWPQLEQEAT